MPERTTDRRRETGRRPADPARAHRGSNSVLALQRSIGNRAVAQVLAREPVRTGTVEIHGIGPIKVKGGNLGDWAGTATLDTVDVTSEKGPQAKKLEQMANARTKSDVKVTIAPTNEAGEHLSVGSFTAARHQGRPRQALHRHRRRSVVEPGRLRGRPPHEGHPQDLLTRH